MRRKTSLTIAALALSLGTLAGCAALDEGVRYASEPVLCYHADKGPKEKHYDAARAELARRRFTCTLAVIEEGKREVAAIEAGADPNMERTMRRDAGPAVTCTLVGNTRICR